MFFVDTNAVSETLRLNPADAVLAWFERHDAELALSSVVIAELAFGIEKIRPDQRALQWLGKEIDDRSGLFSWMVWLKHDPVWKAMRPDHRFKAILRRAGW